jgi:predicted nucleotidyltransferase
VRRGAPLPADIDDRLRTLGVALDSVPFVRFAYLFGSAATGALRPLSDVDVAAWLDDSADRVRARLDLIQVVTAHLGTDAVDVAILTSAIRSPATASNRSKYLDSRLFERRFLDARWARG